MKVLHIITGLNEGGAEGVLYRLVTHDVENRHYVISMTGLGVFGPRLQECAVPVYSLDMSRGRVSLQGLIRLRGIIKNIEPDLVQTWLYHADLVGGLVARFSGVKSIFWGVRSSDAYLLQRSPKRWILWCCAKLSWHIPHKIVYASYAGERVHRNIGYSESKSVVIANGVDATAFRPDPSAGAKKRALWQIPVGLTVIGMFARWDPLKAHDNLFSALHQLSRGVEQAWVCVLIGENMTRTNPDLVELVRTNDLCSRVMLLGSEKDICSAMNAIDIHVLSSKSEGFPNVLVEAMACGIPCVGTDVGDVRSIIEDTGWVVPSADPVALAEALGQAMRQMNDHHRWQARKDECRAHAVRSYKLETMVGSYSRMWAMEDGVKVADDRINGTPGSGP